MQWNDAPALRNQHSAAVCALFFLGWVSAYFLPSYLSLVGGSAEAAQTMHHCPVITAVVICALALIRCQCRCSAVVICSFYRCYWEAWPETIVPLLRGQPSMEGIDIKDDNSKGKLHLIITSSLIIIESWWNTHSDTFTAGDYKECNSVYSIYCRFCLHLCKQREWRGSGQSKSNDLIIRALWIDKDWSSATTAWPETRRNKHAGWRQCSDFSSFRGYITTIL